MGGCDVSLKNFTAAYAHSLCDIESNVQQQKSQHNNYHKTDYATLDD